VGPLPRQQGRVAYSTTHPAPISRPMPTPAWSHSCSVEGPTAPPATGDASGDGVDQPSCHRRQQPPVNQRRRRRGFFHEMASAYYQAQPIVCRRFPGGGFASSQKSQFASIGPARRRNGAPLRGRLARRSVDSGEGLAKGAMVSGMRIRVCIPTVRDICVVFRS